MNSPSQVTEVTSNGPDSERVPGTRRAPRSIPVDGASYHLLTPREPSVPLLREAYELWREGWQSTLSELHGTTRIHSDEFCRQDEIATLCVGHRPVSVMGLRWLDMAQPMSSDDSYFSLWPESVLQQVGRVLIGIPSNLIVHPDWRRGWIHARQADPHPVPIAFAALALAIRRFLDSPAARFIGAARNERSMNRAAVALGGTVMAQIRLHGEASDLISIDRTKARARGSVIDALWSRRHQD